MEILRYKYVFVLIIATLNCVNNVKSDLKDKNEMLKTTINCPFSKLIEDIFKIHNKTSNAGIYVKDAERAKIFLNAISNISKENNETNIPAQDELVNNIIASINRIKENITTEQNNETKLNEAIILNVPKESSSDNEHIESRNKVGQILSGIEEKNDVNVNNSLSINNENSSPNSTEKTNYVEILTVEPNNTSHGTNTSANNIIEVLKHLMPMFNSTLTKELHNITIIERNHNNNHSFSATKNISTIVVTYCDKDNFTKVNTDYDSKETVLKIPINESIDYDYYTDDNLEANDTYDDVADPNLTISEKKDILEAAEYGVKKMHELYSVMEPKLYSMGFWLDDRNPARYVAAFNAPSEDSAKYSRYGYASLQAASRLKQLTSDVALEGRAEENQFPSAGALRKSPLIQHCPLRGVPKCPPASKRYRTHDGTCNNFNRPRWGSTMTPVQRFLPPSYSDGIQIPRRSVFGSKLPSAREISSLIHVDQNVETIGVTHLLMQWGQFIDHDITSSSQSRGFNGSVPRCCKDGGRDFVPREFMHPECLPIAVPSSDPFYGPRGVRCLDFVRSSPAPRDDCALGWREQLNQVSAYIDASPLYASSARQSDKLRLFRNGMLQYGRVQQRRPLLPPERRDELCRGGALSVECFKSGDARVNETPGLVAAHILWLRQHNRMAQELSHLNPHWSDEKIYQETRKIIGAMVQHITYREFLPIVLGTEVMRLFELEPQKKGFYRNYNPKINPSPASSFGSAAFRFGHSLVQSSMVRYDRFHRPINNNVTLHNELTNPSNIWSMGAVDRLLLGMVNQPIQKRDEFMTEELTNHLFQTPHFDFGMDLAAINIQRGRDHGVPPYTAWREPCGLSAIPQFEDLFRVMPSRAVRKIKALYRHVDDIDLFTGGMAERPVVGGLVGPTFACIIAQQFSNLRKGDRFWYENGGFDSSFTPAQLQQIRRITFAHVLCHTLDSIDNIQPFVFLSPDSTDNERISCLSKHLNDFDLSPWVEINSENDISKTDDETTTQKPKRKSTTTQKPTPTTKKQQRVTTVPSKLTQKKPPSLFSNSTRPHNITKENLTANPNKTDTTNKNKYDATKTKTTTDKNSFKHNMTQKIDDKLDFKNKTKRYDDVDRIDRRRPPTKVYNDYDEDDVQSVQSVVINNLSHKRPYNRPVIAVTENVDKYTYLINYVPRPTQSWRQTTRKTPERDVVKVTYQSYDDTYRRPNKPYYNKHDDRDNYSFRRNRPNSYTTENAHSSARSNDDTIVTTTKPKVTIDKTDRLNEKFDFTTENLYKLVTFGYVGTYRGNDVTKGLDKQTDKNEKTDAKLDTISKDFSTYDIKQDDNKTMKLSTFFLYESATKPYGNLQRPTRRHDDESSPTQVKSNSKYYYIKNVLHKYDVETKSNPNTEDGKEGLLRENYNNPGNSENIEIEERSAIQMDILDEKESDPEKEKLKEKKISAPAKTPSVTFQVIPSENSATNWAVYDEDFDLPEGLTQRMPPINIDPYASKEIPRPLNLSRLRVRRPGKY